MQETPFPYQIEGARWLATMPQALLADEMGLGKSAQAVMACDLIGAENILIVSPAAVRINWSREFDRFSDVERPCVVIKTGKDKPIRGVNIVSYDLIASNEKLRNELKAREWDVLVLDEAHYLKERTTKRTKACYGFNKHPGLAGSAKHVWRLTGTPMPNNASELYTQMKSLGAVNMPYWDFVFQYCEGFQADYGYKITGVKNVEDLKRKLYPFMLRRKKDQVMTQLPPIMFQNITVEKTEVEMDPYFYENWQSIGIPKFIENLKGIEQTVRDNMKAIQQHSHGSFEHAAKMLEGMSTPTSTLRRYIGLSKVKPVIDIIEEELATDQIDKIVLFAMHKQVIDEARDRLKKFGAVTLYGGTPADKRQRHIDDFQNHPHPRVFIGQIVAAGTGITLTRASEVAFIEASWVPAENAQACMRCHRITQTRPVRVRFFTAAGTVDEDVMRVVVNKTRNIAKIFD